MVSSLAAQLQQLREGGAGSKRKTDTFLYDSREAAQIDDETVYNVAWNGLLELKQLDAIFEEFDPSRDPARLFSRQRIHFHRVQNTKSDEDALNLALAKLLDALSPYFLLGATHKVLEFLVRRYEIHRFNVEESMRLIISYHESTWFTKMVKILHIHNTRWEFLLKVKQQPTDEPLLRSALVQRAIDDSSVIEFIFDSATRIGPSHPKLISLYALVVLQMLDQSTVDERMLRWLIPELLIALKTKLYPEMQAAAYMILTKLSSKAVLSDKVVEALVKHLVKFAEHVGGSGAQMNALLCLIYIAETQPSFVLTPRVGKHLLAMENLVDSLAEVAGNYDSIKFVRYFMAFLLETMQSKEETDLAHSVLIDCITRVSVIEHVVHDMVERLMTMAAELEYDGEQHARVGAVSSALVAFSKRFVEQTDASVQRVLADPTVEITKKQKKLRHAFLEKTFAQVANSAHFVPANMDATASLALALDHPTESTRYQALQTLDAQHRAASKTDATPVLTTPGVLLRRLQDDSARIVAFVATSSLADLLLALASKKKAFDALVQAVHRWAAKTDDAATRVVDALMELLVSKYRASFGSSEVDEKLLVLALALLPTADRSKSKTQKRNDAMIGKVWRWIAMLEHPFGLALTAAKDEEQSVDAMSRIFGVALAEKDVTKSLPFCLSWSKPSDVNRVPLTSVLVSVLTHARHELHRKKNTKHHKEHTRALDQALRDVLTDEFPRVCELAESAEATTAATALARVLVDVARDTYVVSIDAFDACVVTLLQAPAHVFMQIQGVFVELFVANLENELLPTMARVLVHVSSGREETDLAVVLAKIRALDIISAVLLGGDDEDEEDEDMQRVLPVVMVALGDAHRKVREAALGCLSRWGESMQSSKIKSTQTLLDAARFLTQARSDILMDARAVFTRCGTYHREHQAPATRFIELVINVAIKTVETSQLVLVVRLVELIADAPVPSLWAKTTTFASQLLDQLVAEAEMHRVQLIRTQILKSLIGQYLTMSSRAAFETVVLRVMHTDRTKAKTQQHSALADLQRFTLSRLNAAYFTQLDDVAQHTLVTTLLHLLMVSDESVASPLIRCLSELPLTAAVFVKLLNDELLATATANGTPSKPRGRRAEEKTDATALFQDLTCILDVLAIKVDDVADSDALLQSLTAVLALLCRPEHAERVSEYMLQILFGCLRRVCEAHGMQGMATDSAPKKKGQAASKDGVIVEPEQLVQHTLVCLGRTSSPQTRNDALLFISALVHVYPTSVLQSLDKVLSFVGRGAIHQDDDYSFNVLETIIKAVVPHILAEHESTELITPQQFVRIFIDAYAQIPIKRRELVFQALVEALGSAYLPYVVVAIVESGVVVAEDGDRAVLDERVRFAHQLSLSFDAVTQLAALVKQLRIVRDLYAHVMDDSDTDTDEIDDDDEDEDDEDEGVTQKYQWDARITTSQLAARTLNLALVQFLPAHLQARELHHQIVKLEEDDEEVVDEDGDEEMATSAADKLQQHYLVLAQVVLLYFRRLAHEQSVHEETPAASSSESESTSARGFWTALANQTIEILGALQQLLSTPGFVAVISELLHHDNSLVRKKAMQLFNERLQEDRGSLTPGEELLFIDMVDELATILRNEGGHENTVNIQTALLSVDILARNFAAEHTKKFQTVLPTIIKYVGVDLSPKKDGVVSGNAGVSPMALHLMGCAYVSLSSICRAVGPLVFPFLPKFFPNLLTAIDFCANKSRKQRGNSENTTAGGVGGMKTVLQCLLAALDVFTDSIPQFLTPYLSKIVQVLLTSSLVAKGSGVNVAAQQLSISVDNCFLNLTNHVELRHLLPNLFGSYEFALTQGDLSVEKLFSVVSTVVTELNTADLRQYLPQFARFFVNSLDLRRVHTHRLQDLESVEDEALDVLVQFILRLSEKQLKPLFLKICEWANHIKTSSGEIARKIVFFKLLVKLSERLKSIFVPYFAHVFEMLTKALTDSRNVLAHKKRKSGDEDEQSDADDDDDDDFFAQDDEETVAGPTRKKRKLQNGTSDTVVSRETYLVQLQIAVRALNGCFVHDTDGFMDKDKFDVVMPSLVDTLDILKYEPSAKEFVFDNVSECLANLAWAAKNDLLWKPMHYAVLMKSRGDCAAIRLATLKVVEKCYTNIGDEFLAMLPESIPFLAELMEDNDAEVERTCHQVIKQIEDISGESLDQYLTA